LKYFKVIFVKTFYGTYVYIYYQLLQLFLFYEKYYFQKTLLYHISNNFKSLQNTQFIPLSSNLSNTTWDLWAVSLTQLAW